MRHIKAFILFIVVALTTTACATTQVGNYSNANDQALNTMAVSAIAQVSAVLSPAQSTLVLSQETTDVFGSIILKGLRGAGFAVAEIETTAPAGAIPVSFLLDAVGENFYRLELKIGGARLARAFSVKQGGVVEPSGIWAKGGE